MAKRLASGPQIDWGEVTTSSVRALAAITAIVVIGVLAVPSVAGAATGFKDQSYAGFDAEADGGAITGEKPESKLWYQDGRWWAAMLSPSAGGAHDIYTFMGSGWADTGVQIDPRPQTKEDVLSLGSTLYVLSRSPSSSAGPNSLRRYTYSAGTYVLDAGFPVAVPGAGKETATLTRDTTGTLWITYELHDNVVAVHTLGSDTVWGTPVTLPVAGATGLKGDDISAVIAFSDWAGPAIGVMWSNQNTETDYFAIHRDGTPDSAWTVETALSGPRQADDHINLKTLGGTVYAAVKTNADRLRPAAGPLVRLLVRSPVGGWTNYAVASVQEDNTRPIVLLDTSARQLYVFMTIGDSHPHAIVYKRSPLDSISFSSPMPFMDGGTINNATSTKQNLSSTTGIVVMASDGSNYWWNALGP
jgi:hypothetical protein